MRIVDTHCHLIDRARLRYPWLASVPALDRDFPDTLYRPQAAAAGITDIVHMEVDVAETDLEAEVAWVGGLAPPLAGIVAGCRPERRDFPAHLERLASDLRVKGVRRVLHTQPDALSTTPPFAANVRRLAREGLSFDLCVQARQLPIAAALVRACPDVQFVLDHCGGPEVAAGALDPWRGDLLALAELPNVACKLSGIVAYADPARWTVDDLRPFAEHVLRAFGPERVIWGSDWPVCTLSATLAQWMAATQALLAGASQSERQSILGGNAAQLYGLG